MNQSKIMPARSKTLRNRLVGLLIVVSLVMILIPAMMSPADIYKKTDDGIAVDRHGAMTDSSGQLISGENNYNDLLGPVDDTAGRPDPSEIARQNAAGGGAAADDSPFVQGEVLTAGSNEPVSAQDSVNPFLDDIERLGAAGVPMTRDESAVRTPTRPAAPPQPAAAQKPPAAAASAPAKPHNPPKPAAQNVRGGFTVQVGVYAKQENAQSVISKLKGAGISCRSETITREGRSMFRVFAGQTSRRADAESLADRVKRITGQDVRVVAM